MFENEQRYRSLFNDQANVRHLLLVYRLGEAVAATKDEYKNLVKSQEANETQETIYGYFRYGVFTNAVIFLVAELLSEITGGGQIRRTDLC